MFIVLQLFALAVGYKIFADATKENKKELHSLGRIVGIVIMLLSLAAVAFRLCTYCPSSYKGKMGCPITAAADKWVR